MRLPTERTLNYLREHGAIAYVVERWIPTRGDWKRGRRVDAFGADIFYVMGQKFVAVQSCAGSGHANRLAKSIANGHVAALLKTGTGFEVWSWSQRVQRGVHGNKLKRKRWTPRVTHLTLNGNGEVREA